MATSVTSTLAQTTAFKLPTNRQRQVQIDHTHATTKTKRIHDDDMVTPTESLTGGTTLTSAKPWMVPKKNGHIALCIVVIFHLVLAWSLQSGFMRHVRQMNPVKEALMTYILPAKVEQTPAKKQTVKTLALTPPSEPTLTPIALATTVEPAIETANINVQHTTPPTDEVSSPAVIAIAPKTIISGVEYLLAPQPVYPALAKRAGEQGRVLIKVLVSEKGVPESIDLQKSSGFARLDEAAKQAVLRARFKPYLEDGKALAVYVIVPINFQLT